MLGHSAALLISWLKKKKQFEILKQFLTSNRTKLKTNVEAQNCGGCFKALMAI